MRNKLFSGLVAAAAIAVSPAYGAWVDVSYDPSPSLIDLDEVAKYDTVGILSHVVQAGFRMRGATQNFESGFTAGQVLNDWVGIGGNQVRFGFGSSLGSVDWRARIGQIDPMATAYGLTHPHGTYGNAPGVLGDPRNYVADHYFLTSDTALGAPVPQYFVMQFESPINFLALTLLDYANQVGGLAHLDLYLGDDLATASAVPIVGNSPDRTVGADTLDGAIDYFIARGPYVGSAAPYSLAPFNIAVLRLDTPDGTVGFDNIFVASSVPEPGSIALLLGGLGLLAASRAGRRR